MAYRPYAIQYYPKSVIQHPPKIKISENDTQLIQRVYREALEKDEPFNALMKDFARSFIPCAQANSGPRVTDWDIIREVLEDQGFYDFKLAPRSQYIDFDDIHPLFREENYAPLLDTGLTPRAWAKMGPAHSLATKWLTTPCLQPFWYRIAFGIPAMQDGVRYLARSPIENDPRAAQRAFEELLLDLAKKLTIFWAPQHVEHGARIEGSCTNSIFGFVQENNEEECRALVMRYGNRMSYNDYFDGHIGLTSRYLYGLLSPHSNAYNDDACHMRLQFVIATTLCHEIAHAVYMYRGLDDPESRVYLTDPVGESGYSWIFKVLGGETRPFDPTLRTTFDVLKSIDKNFIYRFPKMDSILHMKWVDAWFRRDTWERIEEVVQNKLLLLPSPRGISGPNFWVAYRYAEGPKGKFFYQILYKDYEVLWPSWAIGTVSAPPQGADIHAWYFQVALVEKNIAIHDGFPSDSFRSPSTFHEDRERMKNGIF